MQALAVGPPNPFSRDTEKRLSVQIYPKDTTLGQVAMAVCVRIILIFPFPHDLHNDSVGKRGCTMRRTSTLALALQDTASCHLLYRPSASCTYSRTRTGLDRILPRLPLCHLHDNTCNSQQP